MTLPLALSAAFVVAVGWSFVGRDFAAISAISAGVSAPLAALACVLCLQRAREAPAERRGWLFLAAARGLIAPISLLAMVHVSVWPYFGALGHLLAVAGIWSWPWRRLRTASLFHALGAALFVGSFVVLLWMTGAVPTSRSSPYGIAVTSQAVRFVLVDGVALYLVSQAPARLRTALGWLVAGSLTTGCYLLAGPYLPGWTWAVLQVIPLSFVLAPWSRRSVEDGEGEEAPSASLVQALFYVPYAAVGAFVLVDYVYRQPGYAPAAAFVGLTSLLVARQMLLLREVGRARRVLEERVLDRTRALEAMQAAMLRTARMNVTATLGAALTHDLNNHLAVILGNASLLQEQVASAEPLEGALVDDLVVASRQAAAMTQRVMSFVRQPPEDPGKTLDLREVVRELGPLLRTIAGRSLELELDVGTQPLPVRSTRARIEQIVVNLISNARDAMPSKGRAVVGLRVGAGDRVQLEVSDNGSGIATDVLPRLFEPFFTTKGEGRGTGLGLVSIKVLAERDAGAVSVASVVGEGTTFTVSWPRAREAA